MLEMHQFAVARYTYRQNGTARLVALVPQREVYNSDGSNAMSIPAGFHMIPLPFADDIRDIDGSKAAAATGCFAWCRRTGRWR